MYYNNKQELLYTASNSETNILLNCASRGLLTDVVDNSETFTDEQNVY